MSEQDIIRAAQAASFGQIVGDFLLKQAAQVYLNPYSPKPRLVFGYSSPHYPGKPERQLFRYE